MKALFLSTQTMNVEPVIASLPGAEVYCYKHTWVPCDQGMLNAIDEVRPDIILYIGDTGGPWLASPSTFTRMRKRAKTVCLAFDASDASWQPHLAEYRERRSFDLVVNIDGNDNWPKVTDKDFTALTPVPPSFYLSPKPLAERPIKIGFCGAYASPSRAQIINHMIEHAGLVVAPRNERFGSYKAYADFMLSCRIVLNVPISGSDNAQQVKGRVVEAGLAGACLLEMSPSASERWFPGHSYAAYETCDDAAATAKYLLSNLDEAQDMADALHQEVLRNHAPAKFWQRIFESVA